MENRNDPTAGQTARSGAQAREELERTRQAAREQLERAKNAGKERLETGKDDVAERTEEIADAVDSAGYELHRQGQQTLASYAGDFAQTLSSFADRLRTSSVDELASDAQALAHRNPRLFVLGSIGVGVVLGRFLKASSKRPRGDGLDASAEEIDEYSGKYSGASAGLPPGQSSYAAGSSPSGDSAGVATSSDESSSDESSSDESSSDESSPDASISSSHSSPVQPVQPERERDDRYADRTTGGP